ncbi:hypothetical protein AAKU55_000370 [Oxalobacteraceae bacterium GrIS 1.11]
MHDYKRPPTLHRYGQRSELELALTLGQFRLTPAANCLTLSFSQAWDKQLFDLFGADSCLIIHNSEEFGERLHRAVQRALPSWAGIDGVVEYGVRAALGAAFSKTRQEASEREWLFAWRSMQTQASLNPVVIQIGSLENFAELRERDAYLG